MVETKHEVPSEYSGLKTADVLRGSRPEKYVELLWTTDPLAPSAAAVQATIAYCNYVFRRYGRFTANTAPFRTVIGFQVCRVDVDFYDRFYEPETLPDSVRACSEQDLLRVQIGDGEPANIIIIGVTSL